MYYLIYNIVEIFLYILYIVAYVLPFVICFIVFKNKIYGTSDFYRDWYHSVKLWWAKTTVKKYQKKCAKILKKELEEEAELPKKLTTFQNTDSQIIYGTDENGNMLYLKLTMRENRLAEAVLELRFADGSAYQLPEHPAVLICSIPSRKWCTTNLEIDIVEPFRTLRITYNGLLKNISSSNKNNDDNFVGISFSFMWKAAGRPSYFPYECHTDVLANAVANEKWKDGQWISLLESEFGYDQYGMLVGQIQRTDTTDLPKTTLRMSSCRKRFWGLSQVEALRHNIQVFAADEQGLCFVIGVKSFKRRCKRLTYGTVILPNRKIISISNTDLSMNDLFKIDICPGVIPFNFQAGGVKYECHAFTYLHTSLNVINEEARGWRCKIIRVRLTINEQQANGYISFWKDYKGKGLKLPPFIRTPYIQIPNPHKRFVATFNDKECRCVSLAGYLGVNLGLLKVAENVKFSVADGLCVLTSAFEYHVETNPNLKEAAQNIQDIGCGRIEGDFSGACQRFAKILLTEPLHADIEQEILDEVKKNLCGSPNIEEIYFNVKLSTTESEVPFFSNKTKKFSIYSNPVENIIERILSCWADAFKLDKVKLRRQNGEAFIPDIAAIIEKVYPSDLCGVLATINPDTGYTGQLILKANYGIDMNASEPDIITLRRNLQNKLIIDSEHIGEKEHFYKISENNIYLHKAADNLKSSLCITSEQILKLYKIGTELEKVLGGPRYIEWAIDKDKIYLTGASTIERNRWSNFDLTHETDTAFMSNKDEVTFTRVDRVVNGALSVLSQSLYLNGFDEGLQKNEKDNISLIFNIYIQKILTSVCHHVGLNEYQISLQWAKSMENINKTQNNLKTSDNLHKRNPQSKTSFLLSSQLYKFYKKLQYHWNFNSYAREARSVCNELTIKKGEDSLSCYREIDKNIAKLIRIGQLYFKVAPFKPKEISGIHSANINYEEIIITSTIQKISIQMIERLKQMKSILESKGLTNKFTEENSADGMDWLKTHCPLVAQRMKVFLNKFGHRGFKEMDLLSKTWHMDQTLLIKALQLFNEKTKSEEIYYDQFEEISSIECTLSKFLNSFLTTTPYEITKSALAKSIHKFRLAYIDLAEKLVSENKLPYKELIFHLTHYEIGKLATKRDSTLIKKAIRRSELFSLWEKLQLSKVNSDADTLNENLGKSDNLRHIGYAVVPGKAVGRVCVINNKEDFNDLQEGDIAITKFTDIGWTVFMPSLSGIVTESSELYSEGPVLAATYNIPCIIAVNGITEYFKTGDKGMLMMENYDFHSHCGVIVKVAEQDTLKLV